MYTKIYRLAGVSMLLLTGLFLGATLIGSTWATLAGTSFLPLVMNQEPPNDQSANVLLLAGDICRNKPGDNDSLENCKKTGDLVRSLLAAHPGAQVQTLGDNVYDDRNSDRYDNEYERLYDPHWGSFLDVTHAAMGNHDIYNPKGTKYFFDYFGAAAGPRPDGYYSYDIGASWHVIVLNDECADVGGCGPGSPQYTWLKADLAANQRNCVLAAWHRPRWTSARLADEPRAGPWWELLYRYKIDLVVNGHIHNYERFNPIDPQQRATPDGIREFVVGTGGAPGESHTYKEKPLDPNQAVRNQEEVYGVLQLTLRNGSYTWKFMPAEGYTFTDEGEADCHGPE